MIARRATTIHRCIAEVDGHGLAGGLVGNEVRSLRRHRACRALAAVQHVITARAVDHVVAVKSEQDVAAIIAAEIVVEV